MTEPQLLKRVAAFHHHLHIQSIYRQLSLYECLLMGFRWLTLENSFGLARALMRAQEICSLFWQLVYRLDDVQRAWTKYPHPPSIMSSL